MDLAMAEKKTFTPASIDTLGKGILRDPLAAGLFIEVLSSGKKRWKYRRRVTRNEAEVRLSFGLFPARSKDRDFQRGFLVLLLTGARLAEVVLGRSEEVAGGVWTIPPGRSKNSKAHVVALGPWGLAHGAQRRVALSRVAG
jgi:integrase